MFYPAGDIKVLSERILQMVNEPELRVRLGRQARNWLLEHSTWKMVTNQYPEFYERVILSS
jgi:glycosyltransferase involved in cell wall biosynthesis